jgi:serine/threonine protein kinase
MSLLNRYLYDNDVHDAHFNEYDASDKLKQDVIDECIKCITSIIEYEGNVYDSTKIRILGNGVTGIVCEYMDRVFKVIYDSNQNIEDIYFGTIIGTDYKYIDDDGNECISHTPSVKILKIYHCDLKVIEFEKMDGTIHSFMKDLERYAHGKTPLILPFSTPDDMSMSEFVTAMLRGILMDLLSCIKYIHGHGITHCDIHGGNVMYKVTDSLEIKTVDYGYCNSLNAMLQLQDKQNMYKVMKKFRADIQECCHLFPVSLINMTPKNMRAIFELVSFGCSISTIETALNSDDNFAIDMRNYYLSLYTRKDLRDYGILEELCKNIYADVCDYKLRYNHYTNGCAKIDAIYLTQDAYIDHTYNSYSIEDALVLWPMSSSDDDTLVRYMYSTLPDELKNIFIDSRIFITIVTILTNATSKYTNGNPDYPTVYDVNVQGYDTIISEFLSVCPLL